MGIGFILEAPLQSNKQIPCGNDKQERQRPKQALT